MKKLMAFVLALIFALGLAGCSEKKPTVWEWAQGLVKEDIVSAIPWRQETINQDDEFECLHDAEILELVMLLNNLTKDSFTHNKHLRGGTPTFGIEIVTASETYHLNQANGPHGSLEVSYNEKLWWIDNAELSAFVQRVTNSNPTEKTPEETELIETVTESEESNFFAFDESLKVSFHDYHLVEETGDWEQEVTEIALTEEETQILLDLLEPYADTLGGDVLKCDYFRYYSIEIDDRMTLTIDPELGNYGENGDSYMLMMEHRAGAYIRGTYIDAELINFLAERLEQTNGV